MIHPDSFYSKNDSPTPGQRRSMWANVRKSLRPSAKLFFLSDRRSFLYGMAASFLLLFSAVGVYTTVRSAVEYGQPQEIKLDQAYQSAIREFEKVALQTTKDNQAGLTQELLLTRKEQLQMLEKAINELRKETNSHDLSEMKRAKLRHLYSLKLRLLQEMVEQGEIEL
jgi:hypothetical protein